MRTRLVIAFIVVALLSALASSWFHTLIGAYRLPTWLDDVVLGPGWLQSLPGAHRSRAASTPPDTPYRAGLLRGGGGAAARDDHHRCHRRFPPGSAARPAAGPRRDADGRR